MVELKITKTYDFKVYLTRFFTYFAIFAISLALFILSIIFDIGDSSGKVLSIVHYVVLIISLFIFLLFLPLFINNVVKLIKLLNSSKLMVWTCIKDFNVQQDDVFALTRGLVHIVYTHGGVKCKSKQIYKMDVISRHKQLIVGIINDRIVVLL